MNNMHSQQSDILIVDDQEDIRLLIQGILEDEGYVTRTAHDSQTAEKLIAEKAPDRSAATWF